MYNKYLKYKLIIIFNKLLNASAIKELEFLTKFHLSNEKSNECFA